MNNAPQAAMGAREWRTAFVLAAIFGLRMLGLFLVLPVFSVFASGLPGGDDLNRVAWAFGAFMLVQAFCHVPLGWASDRFGRKPVIVFGLSLFALGALLAAWAPSINWLTVARVIQGAGAISAAVMALAADLTPEQHRTKVMALIGASIGLVFAFSIVLGPFLYKTIGMSGMFVGIAGLALMAIVLLLTVVPAAPRVLQIERPPATAVLRNPQLLRLNFGVFALHFLQTALFLGIPKTLVNVHALALGEHWKVYLPIVLASFVLAVPLIIKAEKNNAKYMIVLACVMMLALAQGGFYLFASAFFGLLAMLLLFFVAFNVLEASLPALLSKMAPGALRGTAMGVFNTTQALGVALGSACGGWIGQYFGISAIYTATFVLAVIWWWVACGMHVPTEQEQVIRTVRS